MYLSSLFLMQLDQTVSPTSVKKAFYYVDKYISVFPPYYYNFAEIRDLWDVCKEFPEISDYPHLCSTFSQYKITQFSFEPKYFSC